MSFSNYTEEMKNNMALHSAAWIQTSGDKGDGRMIFSTKTVEFQPIESSFLYNALINSNETILINGLEVSVVPSP